MAKIYRELDLPDTCYVQEVAYWLALGRVPEWFYGNDGRDRRCDDEQREVGETIEFDWGFGESEFRFLGMSIDYRRYLQGRDTRIHSPGAYVKEREEKFAAVGPGPDETPEQFDEVRQRRLADTRHRAEEAGWAAQVDETFHPLIDRARADVFKSLAQGELKAIGWVRFEDVDPTKELPPYGEFVDIDPSVWTLRGFDWDTSTLAASGRTYQAVQVDCQRMMEVFPRPSCRATELSVLAYPTVAIVEDADNLATSARPRPRGRPAKQVGSVRDAVRNWFCERLKSPNVPHKTEALIEEAREFVRVVFRQEISRSTAQAYLRGLVPENLPKMAAE